MDQTKRIGTLIRINRMNQRKSLRSLAIESHISASHLCEIENSVIIPRDDILQIILDNLRISYDNLMSVDTLVTETFEAFLSSVYYVNTEKRDYLYDEISTHIKNIQNSLSYPEYILMKFIYLVETNTAEAEQEALLKMLETIRSCFSRHYLQILQLFKAIMLQQKNDIGGAIKILKEISEEETSMQIKGLTHYYLSQLYKKDIRYIEALMSIQKASEIFMATQNLNRCLQVNINLGLLYDLTNCARLAESTYLEGIKGAESIKNDQMVSVIAYNLAWLYAREGKYTQTDEYVNLALKLGFTEPCLYFINAWAYYKMDMIAESRQWIDDGLLACGSSSPFVANALMMLQTKFGRDRISEERYLINVYELSDTYSPETQMFVLDLIVDFYEKRRDIKKVNMFLKIINRKFTNQTKS